MGSLERKIARKQEKEAKKLEKKLTKKLNMFDKLPNNCLMCSTDYDKKNKEQATTWRVIIKEEKIQLFCPKCWIKTFKEKK